MRVCVCVATWKEEPWSTEMPELRGDERPIFIMGQDGKRRRIMVSEFEHETLRRVHRRPHVLVEEVG